MRDRSGAADAAPFIVGRMRSSSCMVLKGRIKAAIAANRIFASAASRHWLNCRKPLAMLKPAAH